MYTTSVSGGDRNFVSILDPNDMGNTYVGQGGNITAMYFQEFQIQIFRGKQLQKLILDWTWIYFKTN